jgi:hypothetical protein
MVTTYASYIVILELKFDRESCQLVQSFRNISQSFQGSARIVSEIMSRQLPSTTYRTHYYPIILAFDAA